MIEITIYTPINENYESLNEIYDSLIKQTFKKFIWFIIDFGFEPKAKQYVEKFLQENKLTYIQFIQRPTKGRYLTTEYAFNNINTKYIIGLDGSYKLTSNAVEIIQNAWLNIETSNKSYEIAEIRGLAQNKDGNLIGFSQYNYQSIYEFIDLTWHEMVLRRNNYYEMLASWNREKFLDCVKFENYTLFSNDVNELNTTLFWSSIGRKYKTRYLNSILKVKIETIFFHRKKVNLYNSLVCNYYFVKENIQFAGNNPTHFLKLIVLIILDSIKLIVVKLKNKIIL